MKAARSQKEIEEINAAITRKDTVQDAFVQMGRQKANAVEQGVQYSSVASGATSSLEEQLAFNIEQLEKGAGLQNTAYHASLNANRISSLSDIFSSAASITAAAKGS